MPQGDPGRFDSHAAPRSNLSSIGEQGAAVREQAFREAVSGLKDAVTSRFVRM